MITRRLDNYAYSKIRTHTLVNYIGQLRAYSYADLVLLVLACGGNTGDLVVISLLWFGFLIFLEWCHRDAGRLTWPWMAWAAPWIIAICLRPVSNLVVFGVLAGIYACKKRTRILGAVAPLANGAMKAALISTIPSVPSSTLVLVSGVMAIRNLTGDIRDAGKDARENVHTIPVLAGYRGSPTWIYPACLVSTSVLWTVKGHLPWWALTAALAVELTTYQLTPR
jgi:1,4-dihydroxy-2-naphthoate octaprenyltransferase